MRYEYQGFRACSIGPQKVPGRGPGRCFRRGSVGRCPIAIADSAGQRFAGVPPRCRILGRKAVAVRVFPRFLTKKFLF